MKEEKERVKEERTNTTPFLTKGFCHFIGDSGKNKKT